MTTTRTPAATIDTNYRLYSTGTRFADLPELPRDDSMDAYLEGFDARHANDTYTSTPAPEVDDTLTADYADWFIALLDRNEVCTDRIAFEHAAHRGYIAHGLSMTNGHFAPEEFDAWVIGFRKAPISELYYGNDARHNLAPQANSYAAALTKITFLPPTPAYDTLPPIDKPRNRVSRGADRKPKAARRMRS